MTVLVTGGAGYIGSHMVLRLQEDRRSVVVLDNLSTGHRKAVPSCVHFVEGDIGSRDALEKIFRNWDIKSVIHFAGSIIVEESVKNPLKYYLNNTANTSILIDYCVNYEVNNFIFSSTAAVYGQSDSELISENDIKSPSSPYGSSKLMSENIIRDTERVSCTKFSILRYFNVAGADPYGRSGQSSKQATHLVKVAVEAALGKRSGVTIFGSDYKTHDGTAVRDYIHVSDLCEAHLIALKRMEHGSTGLTFNCGYGKGYSVIDVLNSVKRVSGLNFPIYFGERRAGDPPRLVASNRILTEDLGWAPRYNTIDHIVRDALRWESNL